MDFMKELLGIRNRISSCDYDDYREYIAGKKVAIVGPSPSEKDNGEFIDSYDIVIRFSNAIEFIPFEKDIAANIGSKSHVIYFVPTAAERYFKRKKIWENAENAGLKIIRISWDIEDGIKSRPATKKYNTVMEAYEDYFSDSEVTPYYSSELNRFLQEYMSEIKGKHTIPRAGMLAAAECFAYGASEIYLSNMTFYHGGTNIFRKDSVNDLKPNQYHNGKNVDWHDSDLELEMLWTLIKYPETNISYDKMMETVLLKQGLA